MICASGAGMIPPVERRVRWRGGDMRSSKCVAWGGVLGLDGRGRVCPKPGQDRVHHHLVRSGRLYRRGRPRRLQLAVEMEGGKLGGVPVQVVVEDDGLKPGTGKQIADKFLKTRKDQAVHRHHLFQHQRRRRARRPRRRRNLCQPECRTFELRRQGVPQELLRGVLAERHAA